MRIINGLQEVSCMCMYACPFKKILPSKKKIHFKENVLVIWKIQGYKHGYFNRALFICKISVDIWICEQYDK